MPVFSSSCAETSWISRPFAVSAYSFEKEKKFSIFPKKRHWFARLRFLHKGKVGTSRIQSEM
jgi:hypothetical protein